MIKLIPFLFLLLCWSAEARSPAVEPVMGLSIEEIDHVPPEEATGFDFSQPENASRSPAIEVPVNYDFNAPTRTETPNTREGQFPVSLIALMLVLPFIIWFGLMRNLDSAPTPTQVQPGTISLEEARKNRESQKEKDNLPKAS